MRHYIVLVTTGALLVSGCDSSTTQPSASKSQKQSEETKSVPQAVPGVTFVVAPNKLRVCDKPTVAKVSWDAMVTGGSVKIFVLDDKKETLFAFGGPKGSADTGPWVNAKTVFVLKDAEETKQLAKFVVGSESCN